MISIKEATNLLKNISFPGEDDPTYSYCISKTKRKDAVRSRSEDCKLAAAIELQSAWRGYRARKKLRKVFDLESFTMGNPHFKKLLGCPKVKARYKEYLYWCQEQGLDLHSTAVHSFEDYCASIIQSWWRRHDSESDTGNSTGGRKKAWRKLTPHTAAKLIQRKWRSYNDVRVFKFYRDLINFKGKGNPKMMLRCINPAEAKLLDKAAGAHVKFRLGGICFPPTIYYKVFTHRPIVDLCASSPRDYTAMSCKQKLPRELHNHTQELTPHDDKDNWYMRYENNGWRPVSDRLFSNAQLDPIAVQTSAKQKEFHYSKLKRKEDLEKKRKQKKIVWLRKMYQEGMIQTHKELSSTTVSAVHLATDQFMELSEEHPEMVDDEDVDELLSWTTALNFDKYTADWHVSASTAFSDMKGDDLFGLTLTTPT